MAGAQSDSDYLPSHDHGENGNNGHKSSLIPGGLVRVRSAQHIVHPDSEENVQAQTEEVFLNYVYQSYQNDSIQDDTDSLPYAPELLQFTTTPITPAAEIGRQLAQLGDEINERYADVFDGMISTLNLRATDSDAYEAFANIARRVFASGAQWSRILILLSFGYRMAVAILRTQASNFASFLRRIVSFICRFFITERITRWIADNGGWRGALSYVPGVSLKVFLLISGLATLSVFAVCCLHKFL